MTHQPHRDRVAISVAAIRGELSYLGDAPGDVSSGYARWVLSKIAREAADCLHALSCVEYERRKKPRK